MAATRQQPLVVEGKDDHHSLLHLLRRTGVLPADATEETSPIQILEAKSKEELLKDIPTRWKEAGITSIGYVLDADDSASEPKGLSPTWDAIRHRLSKLGVTTEGPIPSGGFTARIGQNGPQIGVWIMPDNKSDGTLEDFLIAQIDPQDQLFQFARAKTAEAGQLPISSGRFAESDLSKAELLCWLAWSKKTGQPYGLAMQTKRFDVSIEPATGFAQWVRTLYGL
jgi:hypothetical protein